MIFVQIINNEIGFTHFMPFDEKEGLGKTVEQLSQEGVLVDRLPEPENRPGFYSTMKYNPDTNALYFEYAPVQLDMPERKLQALEDRFKSAEQRYQEYYLLNTPVDDLRRAKLDALDERCNLEIVKGFDYTINGVSYHFSCSIAAQANFQGSDSLFKDNLIETASWTVINNETGKTERLAIDKPTFNLLKLEVFKHINGCIHKLRNVLEPQLNNMFTKEDINVINW